MGMFRKGWFNEQGELVGMQGTWTIHSKDGFAYEGEVNGFLEPHGKGTLTTDFGFVIEGQFENGKITGKGLFKWKNGEIYEGNFLKGIKHGKGIHKWPDGSIYEGKYNNGIREGKAKYKWADGRIFKGYFKDGKPEGKGKITYNGITIECEYKNGKPTSDITKLFKTS